MGLHGDMTLQLVSGPVKIADLYGRSALNPDYVAVALVWTGYRLFVSEISEFRSIGLQQVFEVELDDGAIVRVSPSSHFVMKNGDRKLAPELHPGESLLPLYLEEETQGYPTYRIPGKDVKQKLYRLIAEWKFGKSLPPGTDVEHIDGNRKNYAPDNLRITPGKRGPKKRQKHTLFKAYQAAQELLDECAAASPMLAEIARKKGRNNHKVVRVTPSRLEEVYTASVRSDDSVSVSGVFIELAT